MHRSPRARRDDRDAREVAFASSCDGCPCRCGLCGLVESLHAAGDAEFPGFGKTFARKGTHTVGTFPQVSLGDNEPAGAAALLFGGVIGGHFVGAALGTNLLAALIGRASGAFVGALATVALLRFYRVEENSDWPGQGERAYPRVLAALYLLASVFLTVAWFL